jgi:GDPmannose 4,6-dehydratase
MKTAMITGITGQDGSILAEKLLATGRKIIGVSRSAESKSSANVQHLLDKIEIAECNYTPSAIEQLIKRVHPDEIYHFAGQPYVAKSWQMVPETLQASGMATVHFLEAVSKSEHPIRFFYASSSEIFSPEPNQVLTETSCVNPSTPYGCSKALGYHMVRAYRKQYGIWAANGILFNHESPRRSEDFLIQKIVRSAVRIKLGLQNFITLGNIRVSRDWGSAKDYMDAVIQIIQLDIGDDFIVCSERQNSVEDILSIVFGELGLDYRNHLHIDRSLLRPNEPQEVRGSFKKLHCATGWQPTTTLEDLLREMIDNQLKLVGQEVKP